MHFYYFYYYFLLLFRINPKSTLFGYIPTLMWHMKCRVIVSKSRLNYCLLIINEIGGRGRDRALKKITKLFFPYSLSITEDYIIIVGPGRGTCVSAAFGPAISLEPNSTGFSVARRFAPLRVRAVFNCFYFSRRSIFVFAPAHFYWTHSTDY